MYLFNCNQYCVLFLQEQSNRISDLEEERVKLKEQINELLQKIESLEGESVTDVVQSRLELKIKELESKLELEQTTRGRMETQVSVLIQCYLTINILYILLNTIAQKTFSLSNFFLFHEYWCCLSIYRSSNFKAICSLH